MPAGVAGRPVPLSLKAGTPPLTLPGTMLRCECVGSPGTVSTLWALPPPPVPLLILGF